MVLSVPELLNTFLKRVLSKTGLQTADACIEGEKKYIICDFTTTVKHWTCTRFRECFNHNFTTNIILLYPLPASQSYTLKYVLIQTRVIHLLHIIQRIQNYVLLTYYYGRLCFHFSVYNPHLFYFISIIFLLKNPYYFISWK